MELVRIQNMNKQYSNYKAVIKGLHKNIVDLSTTKERLARMFAEDSFKMKKDKINFGARFENWNKETKDLFESWIPKESDRNKLAYQIQTAFNGSKLLRPDGSFNVGLALKKKSSLKNLQNLGIAKLAQSSGYIETEKPKTGATKVVKAKVEKLKEDTRDTDELMRDIKNDINKIIKKGIPVESKSYKQYLHFHDLLVKNQNSQPSRTKIIAGAKNS